MDMKPFHPFLSAEWWTFISQWSKCQILPVLTPKFHSYSVSALCKGWFQCIAPEMQGLLTLKNHICEIGHHILLMIWEIKMTFSIKMTAKTFYQSWASRNCPSRRSKPWNPVLLRKCAPSRAVLPLHSPGFFKKTNKKWCFVCLF